MICGMGWEICRDLKNTKHFQKMYKIVWKFQRINLLLIAEKIQIVVNYCAKCRIEKSCAKVLVFFFLWYNIVESTNSLIWKDGLNA